MDQEQTALLSQQLQQNANIDTPKQTTPILINETVISTSNQPEPQAKSNIVQSQTLLPETPATPFGDLNEFQNQVNKRLTQHMTMCDLYIPGTVAINEDNEDDDFIQQTQSARKLKRRQNMNGPLTNRLSCEPVTQFPVNPNQQHMTTPAATLPAPKAIKSTKNKHNVKRKRSDKEEMDASDDEVMTDNQQNRNNNNKPKSPLPNSQHSTHSTRSNGFNPKKLSNSEV